MKKILKDLTISVIFPVIASIGTFLITKKKYDSEVQNNELENVQKAITIWRNLSMDQQQKINEQTVRIDELEKEVHYLKINCK